MLESALYDNATLRQLVFLYNREVERVPKFGSHGGVMGLLVVFTVVSCATVGLRLWARGRGSGSGRRGLGIADWTLVVGTVCMLVGVGCFGNGESCWARVEEGLRLNNECFANPRREQICRFSVSGSRSGYYCASADECVVSRGSGAVWDLSYNEFETYQRVWHSGFLQSYSFEVPPS